MLNKRGTRPGGLAVSAHPKKAVRKKKKYHYTIEDKNKGGTQRESLTQKSRDGVSNAQDWGHPYDDQRSAPFFLRKKSNPIQKNS